MSLDLVQKALGDMTEATKAALAANASEIAELKGRLTAAEQEIVDRKSSGGSARPMVERASDKFREAFEAKGAELKALKDNSKAEVRIETPVFLKNFLGVDGGASPADNFPVLPERQGGVVDLFRPITIFDALPSITIGSNAYQFVRYHVSESTQAAAPVAEGDTKPASLYRFELETTSPIVIAHTHKFSQQLHDDAPAIVGSFIPGKMQQGVNLKADAQVLNGSGSGTNLNGLFTQASALAIPGGYTLANDKLGYAAAYMRAHGYLPGFIVINPLDAFAIRTVKASGDGQYLQYESLFAGLPTIESPNVTAGTALVMDPRSAAVLNRTGVQFIIGYSGTDFEENKLTARCEVRIGLAVYDAGGMRTVSLS